MRAKNWTFAPANVNLIGYYSNMTGAGPFTMTTTNSGDNLAHLVTLRNDTANSKAGITFTLTGTDADGKAQTESLAGPGVSATVTGVKYFKTLTTISVSGSLGADTVDAGWANATSSQTIPLNWRKSLPPSIEVDITGTCNYDIEVTMRDPWATSNTDQESLGWQNDANWTGKSADLIDDLALNGERAMRFILNSYTNGLTVGLYATFPGYST